MAKRRVIFAYSGGPGQLVTPINNNSTHLDLQADIAEVALALILASHSL